jgi:hypothetical protein
VLDAVRAGDRDAAVGDGCVRFRFTTWSTASGTEVKLANGGSCWATICNVDVTNARLTEHFLTLSVIRDGRWFHLARYHDFDHAERGPEALARFLELPVDQVFPITCDVTRYARGDAAALHGQIRKAPRERLTRSEVIALAVP